VADENGEFKYQFAVGDEVGMVTVEVTGGVPSRVGEATFKVLPQPGIDT
jgi:hypothetical protein